MRTDTYCEIIASFFQTFFFFLFFSSKSGHVGGNKGRIGEHTRETKTRERKSFAERG